ncbi:MAG: hypothetical protein ACK5B3_07900 [Bacteroidota bacterium]|jgi:hypothetical protein
MLETITLRPSVEDWRHDLDLSMSPLGIYRMDFYKKGLFEQLRKLENLLREYQGVVPHFQYSGHDIAPYWYLFEVRVNNAMLRFKAMLSYELDEANKLIVKIHFTDRPSTEEFPIEEGVAWKTLILDESDIKDPAYVAAYVKNLFISFESYRQIGREILYAVLQE